jgi:hypothetical protein
MDDRERQIRKELSIPMGADVQIIDLDAQRQPPEMVTAGWTDTQIRNKSLAEIEDLIRQNELAVESMEKAIAQQRNQINNIKAVRQRKLIIGDS